MSLSGDDMPWLEKLIGAAGAAIVAIVSGAWFASAKAKEHEMRLQSLEDERRRMTAFCASQKAEIFAELRKELCGAFREMLKDTAAASNRDLYEIKINVAVLVESHKGLKEDVGEIFQRINRRDPGNQHHRGIEP